MHQSSEAKIASAQPSRIAKRLLNHWKHKFETAEDEQQFSIYMPAATVLLRPASDELHVRIQLQDETADLGHLENVVLDHLIRIGQEELQANWQRI